MSLISLAAKTAESSSGSTDSNSHMEKSPTKKTSTNDADKKENGAGDVSNIDRAVSKGKENESNGPIKGMYECRHCTMFCFNLVLHIVITMTFTRCASYSS